MVQPSRQLDQGRGNPEKIRPLAELASNEWALVHDAARPCVNSSDISRLIERIDAEHFGGGILATPVRDTMKRASADTANPVVLKTEERENLWHALTPQLFRADRLREALAAALSAGAVVTDEASAMEFAGYTVELIDSDPANGYLHRHRVGFYKHLVD